MTHLIPTPHKRSIVVIGCMCVFLSVLDYISGRNYTSNLYQCLCMLPIRLCRGPPLAALRYAIRAMSARND